MKPQTPKPKSQTGRMVFEVAEASGLVLRVGGVEVAVGEREMDGLPGTAAGLARWSRIRPAVVDRETMARLIEGVKAL